MSIKQYINLIKKHSFFNNLINYQKLDKMTDLDSIYKYLTKFDKHSYLIPKDDMTAGDKDFFDNYKKFMPKIKFKPNHLTIKVPSFVGILEDKYGVAYSNCINNALYKAYKLNINNITIDLQNNQGGTLNPMIMGLSSLLSDNTPLMYFLNNKKVIKDYYYTKSYKLYNKGGLVFDPKFKNKFRYDIECKIIVLVNDNTMSSGEMTALCFVEQDNVMIKGTSFGLLTNIKYGYLSNGTHYGMTNYICADRTKVVHKKIN